MKMVVSLLCSKKTIKERIMMKKNQDEAKKPKNGNASSLFSFFFFSTHTKNA